jgi:hypothetical protein
VPPPWPLSATSLFLATTSAAAPDSHRPEALRIMLTNDDGYNAPGLLPLAGALRADGQDVRSWHR